MATSSSNFAMSMAFTVGSGIGLTSGVRPWGGVAPLRGYLRVVGVLVAQNPGEPMMLGPGEPLACMFRLDCLIKQVETASNAPSGVASRVMPPDTVPTELPPAV
jgi:hypothetical protein